MKKWKIGSLAHSTQDQLSDIDILIPADLDAIETGLIAAGISIRPSQYDHK